MRSLRWNELSVDVVKDQTLTHHVRVMDLGCDESRHCSGCKRSCDESFDWIVSLVLN